MTAPFRGDDIMHNTMFQAVTRKLFALVFFWMLSAGAFSSDGLTSEAEHHSNSGIFQLGQPIFEKVSDSNSLAVITDIVEADNGVFWLGTQHGLFRYDGVQYVPYLHDPNDANSIVDNYVYRLWQAPSRHIWVGTRASGLSVFAPDTGRFTRLTPLINNVENTSQIFDITGDEKQVFVATAAGLVWLDHQLDIKGFYPDVDGCSLSNSSPRHLIWQDENTLLSIETQQVCKIKVNWFARTLVGEPVYQLPGGSLVTGMLDGNTLWVGGRIGGIKKIQLDSGAVQLVTVAEKLTLRLEDHIIFNIKKVSKNRLWAGTYQAGIAVIDSETAQVISQVSYGENNKHSLGVNSVSMLHNDRAGLLWVGTWGGGLFKHKARFDATRYFNHDSNAGGLRSPDVYRSLQLPNGDIWFALSAGGIDRYDAASNSISQLPLPHAIDDKAFVHMLTLPDGMIWLASRTELIRFDPNTDETQIFMLPGKNAIARVIAYDHQDVIWVGLLDGLLKFDMETKAFERIEQVQNENALFKQVVEEVIVDRRHRVWIATNAGLYQIDEKGRFLSLGEMYPNSAKGVIFATLLDSFGRVWVVNKTQNAIFVFDATVEPMSVTNVTELIMQNASHLQGRYKLNSVLAQDILGRIWTSDLVIDATSNSANLFHIKDFTVWNNSQIMTKEGGLIISGPEGVILVDTIDWRPWQYHPPVLFNQLQINNTKQLLKKQFVSLPPNTKSLRLDFVALDYLAPETIEYAYLLEGYDDNWNNTFERHITYTNLSPGDYKLKVKSRNSEGQWCDNENTVLIRQLPAWYQTYWFFGLCLLVLAFIAYGVMQWRIAGLKKQQRVLSDLVEKRTSNLVELGRMGQEITSSLELSDILNKMYTRISGLMDSYVFLVAVVNNEAQRLDVLTCYEAGEKIEGLSFELDDVNRPGPWCVANHGEIVAQSAVELTQFTGHLISPRVGTQTESVVYMPLVSQGKVIGCLSVQSQRPNAYPENTIDMLRTISTYAAIALDNANAHAYLVNAQEKLIEAGKLASLGHLVTGIAHEINTPVGIALTTSTSLGSKAEEIKLKLSENKIRKSDIEGFVAFSEQVDQLLQSSLNRCSKLVQDFKKISSDQFVSGVRTIRVQHYLREIFSAFSVPIAEHGVKVTVTGENPSVDIDPGIFSQVIGNLINNAIAHAFEGVTNERLPEILIDIALNRNAVVLTFADNGIGMDKKTQEQIFIPFFTTKRGTESTGLGLNIVYNLVVSGLNGSVKVTSSPGEGTQFELSIPVATKEIKA